MNPHWISVSLLVAALALVACNNNAFNPEAEPQDRVVEVDMTDDMQFQPRTVTVQVGGTVRWTNNSNVQHTVTADPDKATQADNVELPDDAEPFDSGVIEPGGTFEHTFDVPGNYRYVCLPHEEQGMIGEIRVIDSE